MINEAKAVSARLREGWTYGLLSEAADTIDALIAEVERLREWLELASWMLKTGMPEYDASDVLDVVDAARTTLHSATLSADSAEPFCNPKTCKTCRHNGDDDRCVGCYENHEWEGAK